MLISFWNLKIIFRFQFLIKMKGLEFNIMNTTIVIRL